jgi:putative flippase GtrA
MSVVAHIKARPEMMQIIRFICVGGLNTAFGYAVFFAVHWVSHSGAFAAIVSTVIGVGFNFLTTGKLVFGGAHSRQLARFCMVYSAQVGLNIALLALAEQAGLPTLIAQLIILPCLAVCTYLALRRFVFDRPLEGQL